MDASSSRLRRAFLSAGLAFAVAATLLSASRAAIAVLAVLAVIAAWVIVAQSERRARLRTAVVAAVALALTAGIALAIPLTRTRLLGTSASAEQSVSTRLSIWDAAGRFLGEHPLLGAGPSGFLDALSGYSQDSWASEVGAAVTIDSPHNWLLQAAVAGGIPLMLCAIAVAALVLWTGVQSWRGERSPARIALLAGGTLAILGYGVALLTHFTTPGTTILAAFLAGAIVATVPGAAVVAVVARVRLAVVVVWVAFLGVSSAAEVPLGTAVRQAASGETAAASASFAAAQALRPWDADISSIAAQSFAAAAEAQASGAAQESVAWAQRSLELVPGSVATSKALAVGLQQSGDLVSAERVLADLSERAPGDPQVLHRLGGLQFLLGNTVSATQNLERASDLDPRNLDIWLTLRYVYQSTGDAQGASRADQAIARLGG